jgi:hypothetical protein
MPVLWVLTLIAQEDCAPARGVSVARMAQSEIRGSIFFRVPALRTFTRATPEKPTIYVSLNN